MPARSSDIFGPFVVLRLGHGADWRAEETLQHHIGSQSLWGRDLSYL